MYRLLMFSVLVLAVVPGCRKEADAAPEPPRTQRERDSVLGQSKVPGATGVGKALMVADSAGGRVQLQDSISASQ